MIDAQTIAEALDGKPNGKGFRCHCPVREHSSGKTLDVTDGNNGRPLVHCHAGCDFRDISSALRDRGLWPDATPEQKQAYCEQKRQEKKAHAELVQEIAEAKQENGELLTEADEQTVQQAQQVTMEGALAELAALSPIEYDQIREKKAKDLRVRVSTLDKEVAIRRCDAAEQAVGEVTEGLEPWPEPVNGSALLDTVTKSIAQHVVMPKGAATAVALWSVGTFCMDAWRIWPKLLITSPEKRCGKSTLLEAIEAAAYRPMLVASITASALFRSIEEWKPTLLIDEADTFAKDNDELNGIINAGHTKRTATVIRSEKEGDSFKPKKFSVWCPQVIAGIKSQRDTLHDRSIHIQMRRKLPGESVQKMPLDHFERCIAIRRQCLRWAIDNMDALRRADPEVPGSGNDRAQDNWTPLFALAGVAGGQWLEKVESAYRVLAIESDDGDTIGPMILNDIREIFEQRGVEHIWSADLVDALIDLEERPWCEWKHGKPITKNSLANLLKPYEIKSGDIRFGPKVQKGYRRKKFEEAWGRYLPPLDTPCFETLHATTQ